MPVDQHQRRMWQEMLKAVDDVATGTVGLGQLVRDLRGLYVEADPHDPDVGSEFEAVWSGIDGENELRTEAWAPVGIASEQSLRAVVKAFTSFVEGVLAADTGAEHR